MDDYTSGYRDALKAQEKHHESQARHYRNALHMAPTERSLLLNHHTQEAERLRKQIEELERAATPIPMPARPIGPAAS
jgi:hypothetical protein